MNETVVFSFLYSEKYWCVIYMYRCGNKENHAMPVNLSLGCNRVSVHIINVVSIPRILKAGSSDSFQTDENRLILFSSCNDQ
jgi:hypothetical protein